MSAMSAIETLKYALTWKKSQPSDCDVPTGSPAAVTINDDDRTRIEGQTETAPIPISRTDTRDTHPAFPIEHRKFGNPAPLGLFGFAATTLMLGLYYVQTRHITVPNMVVGMAFAFGGLAQILAGMWEFGVGNTFGATVFSSYGGFWISYAIILFPPSGIIQAYAGEQMDEFNDAIGIFLMVWFIVSLIFFFGTFKSPIMLSILLTFVCTGFMLLMIGQFRDQVPVLKAGGVFCCLAAITAFYIGAAELHSSAGAFCLLPLGLKETSVHGLCTRGNKMKQ